MRIPDYSVTGAGEVTVVLLHGAFGAKDYWLPQVRALVDAGYRVLAWDAPGYGLSPLPEPFGIAEAARALLALLDVAGGRRNVVLGHSMGGFIAQRAYGMDPSRIHGLVLSATSAAFGKADGDWQRQFVADRLAPLEAGRSLPDFAPAMLRRMMAPDAAGPDVDRVISIVGMMRPETFRAAVRAITTFDGRDVLPRIAVPVLAIAGRHDRLAAPPEVMEKMAARIAGAEFACLEDSGHFAWAEETSAFNALLLDFLARRCAA